MNRSVLASTAFVPVRKKAVAIPLGKRRKVYAAKGMKRISGSRHSSRYYTKKVLRRPRKKKSFPKRKRTTVIPLTRGDSITFQADANRGLILPVNSGPADPVKAESNAYPIALPPLSHTKEKGRRQILGEKAYEAGFLAGAEELVAAELPPYMILPEVTARQIISAGLQHFTEQLIPLLRPEAVYQRINEALILEQPLSIVRLGDGELLTLAHETILPLEQAHSLGNFLPYAGVTLPDSNAREMLAKSLLKADIIGIPQSRLPTFQGLLTPILRHYGLSYDQFTWTTSTINYSLLELNLLQSLLRGRKVLIIGNAAADLESVLSRESLEVTGVITPVNGFKDISSVIKEAASRPFDIALVSSGIPAVVICQRIASELGKIAFDFGHLADKIVSGEMTFRR